MIDIFSTRELATIVWLTIFLLIMLLSKSFRPIIIDIVKSFFNKYMTIFLIILFIYSVVLINIFSMISLLNQLYLKDIVLTILLVIIPMCFNVVLKSDIDKFFKKILLDNLKLIVVSEFLISSTPFNFWIEFILLPLILFIVILDIFANHEKEYSVKLLTQFVLSTIGIALLVTSIIIYLGNWENFSIIDTIFSLTVSFIMTILYIPVAYMFALYGKYNSAFAKLNIYIPDKTRQKQYKYKIIKKCNLSYKRIKNFESRCIHDMYMKITDDEFIEILNKL